MKLEQQVTSLEISKRLCELGISQESLFYWQQSYSEMKGGQTASGFEITQKKRESKKGLRCFSAFTVAELGEMLPPYVMSHKVGTSWFICIRYGGTLSNYRDLDEPIITELTNEANGRGKMLIWYLENKDSMRPEFQNKLLTLTKDI